jgi:hypothetical protein
MIRDGAPFAWTSPMRLVACEIADDAPDPDENGHCLEGAWPRSTMPIEGDYRDGAWCDGLSERTGQSPRALSRTLTDLANAHYEMRVPIVGEDGRPVTDKRGRLVYAAKGHALCFQVPPLAPRAAPSDRRATADHLYVIGDGSSLIKIGRSVDPGSRLKTLQAGSSRQLRILLLEAGRGYLEIPLHGHFHRLRVHREWFDFADADPVAEVLAAIQLCGEGTSA